MTGNTHVCGEVSNRTDIRHIFERIRDDVQQAYSRDDLTNLYSRAGYLITLTHASSWEEKFGEELDELRNIAEEEFSKTARMINNQADRIGTHANYDETWGD
jgi:hypothetical protein